MKVEFEARDDFGNDGRPLYGEPRMKSVLEALEEFLLQTMDETIFNVKINGKDILSV